MLLATPPGFRDVLPDEAAEREQISRRIQDLFAANGFQPIETPTLEALDVMRAGGRIATAPFRFFDSRGDLLAMRPDVTMQVARMCATRMPREGEALRLRYMQRVFRESDEETQARSREITQMGVEIIGASGEECDQGLIELMVEALRTSGVTRMTLALASVAPLRALLERSGASEAWKAAVMQALHESDLVGLDGLCDLGACDSFDVSGIAPAYAMALQQLSRIRGGAEAIAEARDLLVPLGCADGLAELEATFEALAEAAVAEVLVDFSLASSFDYYTGIVFEAYSPFLGTALGSGGRYDNLLAALGAPRSAAGFAFCLESAMAAVAAEEERIDGGGSMMQRERLRIAVPKGALNEQAIACLAEAGLDIEGLASPGRQLIVSTSDADYIIVRPSDAPAFIASGAADCGICGRDSLLESEASVVELADLGFGACRFVVAEPAGAARAIEERYRKLGSIRVATKYPNITLAHYARTGMQVDIVRLHGNIELAPLTGMAEQIVDITATGTTLAENDLVVVEEVLGSTARFFANPCALRTNARVIELARRLAANARGRTFDPIAGKPIGKTMEDE